MTPMMYTMNSNPRSSLAKSKHLFDFRHLLVLITFHSDLHFIDTYLGDTELIASDHLDVINTKSVEGVLFLLKLRIFSDYAQAKARIHLFNDSKYHQEAIPVHSWFSRFMLNFNAEGGTLDVMLFTLFLTTRFIDSLQEITLHCICETSYSPVTSNQRYCQPCTQWFNVACMIPGP
jgi:hypothetical protein